MKNVLNFFFSFDKLLKEKLIIPFFWLAIISWGLAFFSTALDSISLGWLAAFVDFFRFFVTVALALVVIRLIAELATALFRINDNLSPDGGKSELADIDILAETKKAAEAASQRAKEFTHTATEKTKSSFDNAKDSLKDNMEDVSDSVQSKAKSASEATKKATSKAADTVKAKTSEATKKASETVKAATPKKPSAKKPAAKKTTAKTTTAKRGPKPGTKAPRDKDGNLLKKDGTPRKKPGPRPKT